MIPAYAKLLTFFRNEYVPQARTRWPPRRCRTARRYYQAQIHEYTTLDLTPDEIHQIGLRRGGEDPRGDAARRCGRPASRATLPAFLQFLRTDPQFYAKTPDELLDARGLDGQEGRRQVVGK